MQKILLFSRLKLVDLYGSIHHHLCTNFDIVHLAYSQEEAAILTEKYHIKNVKVFRNEIKEKYSQHVSDEKLIDEIDSLFIEQTNGRFNLNGALQSDRTFNYYDYEDVLNISQVYYKFWCEYISKNNIDYFIHEPTAMFITHLASVVCSKYDTKYISPISIIGIKKFNWIFVEGDQGKLLHKQSNGDNNSEKTLIITKEFIDDFRKNHTMLLSNLKLKSKNYSFFPFLFKSTKIILKHNKYSPKRSAIVNHVEAYPKNSQLDLATKLYEFWRFNYKIKFDSVDEKDKYFYYPLHTEPEAVVLYWGDAIYKNQVKLIENIAASLPNGYFLYVKDHPSRRAFQHSIYYNQILSIINVKMVKTEYSGSELIKRSEGVITINGTGGLEGLIYGKNVYLFGNVYYDFFRNVTKVEHIKNLKSIIYKDISNKDDFESLEHNLIQDLTILFNCSQEGFTAYFSNFLETYNINLKENALEFSQGVKNYFLD